MIHLAKFFSREQIEELRCFEKCGIVQAVFYKETGRLAQMFVNGVLLELSKEECEHLEMHLKQFQEYYETAKKDREFLTKCAQEGPIIPGNTTGRA